MTIVGVGGERTVPAEEFFLGVYMTAVGPGELLTKVAVPAAGGAGDGWASVTLGKDGTGIVNVAASVRANGKVSGARVVVGCVSAVPERAAELERRLVGRDLDEQLVREAARGLGASLDPPSDVHASAAYRRHLAEVLAMRAVLTAFGRAGS